jgi:hypothetical protein
VELAVLEPDGGEPGSLGAWADRHHVRHVRHVCHIRHVRHVRNVRLLGSVGRTVVTIRFVKATLPYFFLNAYLYFQRSYFHPGTR